MPSVCCTAAFDGRVGDLRALLLAEGIDPDEAGSRTSTWGQWTPLHAACRGQQNMAVTLLLDFGADVHAVDGHQQTPLHVAAGAGAITCVMQLLIKASKGLTRMAVTMLGTPRYISRVQMDAPTLSLS
jgi:hypothetical protein